jgi:hypothetical protein
MDFQRFKKIPRLSREIILTEKVDGSNGQIFIVKEEHLSSIDDYFFIEEYLIVKQDNLLMFAGSRNRWLQVGKNSDNMGFASWVNENAEELFELGEGRHYGEWYGKGIQRGYGLDHKRFALFNISKWFKKTSDCIPPLAVGQNYCPSCCEVVPVLYQGIFDTTVINVVLEDLKVNGSKAVPGYFDAEGICIYHTAAGQYFKKTIKNDQKPKGIKE